MVDRGKKVIMQSDCPPDEPAFKTQYYRPYKRQCADNEYNDQVCEFKVLQTLQKSIRKVKDSHNLFYKRVNTLIVKNDPKYNKLSKMFGFKVKLIKDPEQPGQAMEIFTPTLKLNAMMKVY